MHIEYITNSEVCEIVRNGLCKLPRDISGVVFVPKCGMVGATAVSQFLGKPLYTVDGVLEGCSVTGEHSTGNNKWLVVLDSLNKETKTAKRAREMLKKKSKDVVFALCVSDETGTSLVDVVLRKASGLVLCESNLFSSDWIGQCVLGIEGVLCERQPVGVLESNGEEYENYVVNAHPFMLPKIPVLALCTNRLIGYSKQTGEWLAKHKVGYNTLWMLDFPDYDTKLQNVGKPVYTNMKTSVYDKYKDALMFVEGNWNEGLGLFKNTGRPVLCMDRNILLQN